jgi:hypothetical protein
LDVKQDSAIGLVSTCKILQDDFLSKIQQDDLNDKQDDVPRISKIYQDQLFSSF